jgi:hypothetical protein
MPNVIDYMRGEAIDPVTGKPIKRVTTGVVPTNFDDMLLPVAVGNDQFYAPGFGSNLLQNLEYYDEPPAQTPKPVTQGPAISGQIPKGNSIDARNDDKTRAGAINNFGDWVDAIMAGSTMLGLGGPFKAVASQVSGTTDYGDTYGNANQEDPEGWADAVEQASNSLPPGTNSSQVSALAAQIYGNTHPNWGGGGAQDGPSSGGDGGWGSQGPIGTDGKPISSQDIETGQDMPVDFEASAPTVTKTSTPKPTTPKPTPPSLNSGNNGGGGGGGSDGTGAGGKAGADPLSGSGGSGMQGGPGPATGSGGFGWGMAKGGYIIDQPTSVTQRRAVDPRRPDQTLTAQPIPSARQVKQRPLMRSPHSQAPFAGMNRQPRAFAQSSDKGFAEGGFVPKAGYQMGGAVNEQGGAGDMRARFNPSPDQIADDGMVDNQPINADEGEYVINRESAEILGPELLNAINNPEMALALSDLVEDVLALQGGGMRGGAPAPALSPSSAGQSPSQDAMPQQRTAGIAPSNYRKGGYVRAMRGSLSKVRC